MINQKDMKTKLIKKKKSQFSKYIQSQLGPKASEIKSSIQEEISLLSSHGVHSPKFLV